MQRRTGVGIYEWMGEVFFFFLSSYAEIGRGKKRDISYSSRRGIGYSAKSTGARGRTHRANFMKVIQISIVIRTPCCRQPRRDLPDYAFLHT